MDVVATGAGARKVEEAEHGTGGDAHSSSATSLSLPDRDVMTIRLTSGAIARMCHPTVPPDDSVWTTAPILQVLHIKEFPLPSKPGQIRRRGLLSDGTNYAPVMFGPQLTARCEEGILARRTVICATHISCSVLQEKRILILRECEFVETLEDMIGNPQHLGIEGAPAAAVNDATASAVSPSPAVAPFPTPPQQTTIHPEPQASATSSPSGPRDLIANLSPYLKEWTIEARVTDKSEMRHWSNEQGTGQLFDCTFADRSGDIRATVVAGVLFENIHVGRTYYVSKARISIAGKAFFDANRTYELVMDANARIEEVGRGEAGFLSQRSQ